MSRMLKFLLILCVAAASTAAAAPKKNADVERAVKADLVGKAFTTKILVGTYVPCPQRRRDDGVTTVETELSPEGAIRYLASPGCLYGTIPTFGDGADINLFGPAVDIAPPDGGYSILPGTVVIVERVDFRAKGIEVRLHATNDHYPFHVYGTFACIVGAEYRTWSTDEVMEVIARGIQIPTYEKLVQLKSEFEELRANLQEAESQYNAPGADTHSKLVSAIALREVLEKLQRNRVAFMAMGKSDPQAGIYSEKLRTLTPEIARLSDEVHKERVAHVQEQLQAQLHELSEVQTQVRQKPPSSLAEWQQRSDSLIRYTTLLNKRQGLLNGLKNENVAPTPEDYKYMDESRAEIETVQKALELGRQQLELADLTSQYGQLTKRRAQVLDSYSRAFGTASEKAKLQDLIAVLGQMVTNRERAAELGDKTAATQLIKCRAEAEKYKRK